MASPFSGKNEEKTIKHATQATESLQDNLSQNIVEIKKNDVEGNLEGEVTKSESKKQVICTALNTTESESILENSECVELSSKSSVDCFQTNTESDPCDNKQQCTSSSVTFSGKSDTVCLSDTHSKLNDKETHKNESSFCVEEDSSSVGFEYCEVNDITESSDSTNFRNVPKSTQLTSDISYGPKHVELVIEPKSDNLDAVTTDICTDNVISESSKCIGNSDSHKDFHKLCDNKKSLGNDKSSCSLSAQGVKSEESENELLPSTITSSHSGHICHNKSTLPSVQARRLKLNALVENIKSLKAAELRESVINVHGEVESQTNEFSRSECDHTKDLTVHKNEVKDKLHKAQSEKLSNINLNSKESNTLIKELGNHLKVDTESDEVHDGINSDSVCDKSDEVHDGINSDTVCDKSDDVKNIINSDSVNDKYDLNIDICVNEKGKAKERIEDHFTSDQVNQDNICDNTATFDEDDDIDVVNLDEPDVSLTSQNNLLKCDQKLNEADEVSQNDRKEDLCISDSGKSTILKAPIFQFDKCNFPNVIGNKRPVVFLGKRVSKDKTLDEASKLTKLANIKHKKPVKKIEMIRHPCRRIKRVASLNALAMVNILFGKDDSPPKSTKPDIKKAISSKTISKAKMMLEAKVKNILKRSKASDIQEDNSNEKVIKGKTSPKRISQIEKSLAKLTLDSPPSKSGKKSVPNSPTKLSIQTNSPTKSPTKSLAGVISPKSPTKTSSPKSSSKTSKSSTVKSSTKETTTKLSSSTSKAKTADKENSSEAKKMKKIKDVKQVKGEKAQKCVKNGKSSKSKKSELDQNKDTQTKRKRRKKDEMMRSARTHALHEIKNVKSDKNDQDKNSGYKQCVNCQQGSSVQRKHDGDSTFRHEDKNSYIDSNVQYNRGHMESGTYNTHSYGVVQNLPGQCVHCSQNGSLYSSQGSSFIGGIMGQPGGLVTPCQTFTIGSVPMVQYHHTFGPGYPIQYQSHNTIPHCGCPTCYYYTPTASPLHHDACHHSVPPSYTPICDPSHIDSSHIPVKDDDVEVDVIGGISPCNSSNHHSCADLDVEIDVVGGVPPLSSCDAIVLQPPKKKKKKDSEKKEKVDQKSDGKILKKLDKDKKVNKNKSKKTKDDKKEKKLQLKKRFDKKETSKNSLHVFKTLKNKSGQSTDSVTKDKSEAVDRDKKKTSSKSVVETLQSSKLKKSSKTKEDGFSENKKAIIQKSTDKKQSLENQKPMKRKSTDENVENKIQIKRKSTDSIFIDEPGKQNKFSPKTKVYNRSKSVDVKLLRENKISKTYPKRKRVSSLSRQTSVESITVQKGKPSVSAKSSVKEKEKKKTETKKPKKKNHNWEFESPSDKRKIMVSGTMVDRDCYPAIRHTDGDIINVRDVVILRSGPRKTDIPFLGKVTAFWEENGEMMMSLLWYYHPEHTDSGRLPHHLPNEIFASKHRDENSVACIDDKGYVLTYNEYCRYRAEKCRTESSLPPRPIVVPVLDENPRLQRIPPPDIDSNTVYMCRQVYDFKLKRILKNPS